MTDRPGYLRYGRIAAGVLVVVAAGTLTSITVSRLATGAAASAAYYDYCPPGGAGAVYYGYCPPTKASPTLTTRPQPVAGPTGSEFRDEATLSGGDAPTGTITFKLYGPDDLACLNSPAFTSVVTVSGNGTYTSGAFTPSHSQFGTYQWTADYSGDPNNNPASSPCGLEPIVVTRVPAHFKGYDAGSEVPLFVGEDIVLEDQFIRETVHRGPPRLLLTPVEKRRVGRDPEPILRPEEHLKCYRVTGGKRQDRIVRVSNQFVTGRELLVKEPNRLCAPASKGVQDQQPTEPPADSQHYKCYRVEERPSLADEEVDLVDQFGLEHVVVRRAESLCNPVTKERASGERVVAPRPADHLVCYGIIDFVNFVPRNVHTLDQFGRQRIRLLNPLVLCVPSEKLP